MAKSCGLIYLFLSFFTLVQSDPTVKISNGRIEGRVSTNPNNKTFYIFQGIPFAKPPINELRFEAPVAPDDWNGVLDAKSKNVICPQSNYDLNEVESEDCLYLNVYTPQLSNELQNASDLPVMLFLFGGAFMVGSALYNDSGPEYFIDYDVILITTNYRLGAFGFLSTEDTIIPGNNGLKDQQMALKWVQKNIKYFGGDAAKVTIFGNSAGSASVGYQILSTKSAGLFRAAIMESGSPLCPWAVQKSAKSYAFETGKYINSSVNIENTSSKALLEILKKASFFEVKNASAKIANQDWPPNTNLLNGFEYAPVVEQEHDGAFITKNMYELLQYGNINRVPTMMGFTDEEMVWRGWEYDILKIWDDNRQNLVPDDMHLKNESESKIKASESIHQFYVGDGLFENNLASGIKYWSNDGFNRAILKQAELQAQFTDVYFYQFAYFGKLGGFEAVFDGTGRVQHGAELNYLFRISTVDLNTYPKEDVLMHERMITLWTNFAKYLVPTPEKSELLQNVNWTKVEPSKDLVYLNINNTMSIEKNPKNEMYKLWNEVYNKYAIPPFDTY